MIGLNNGISFRCIDILRFYVQSSIPTVDNPIVPHENTSPQIKTKQNNDEKKTTKQKKFLPTANHLQTIIIFLGSNREFCSLNILLAPFFCT